MTLIEMMISLSVSIVVLGGVISTFIITGRTIKVVDGSSNARNARQIAINAVRFHLTDAKEKELSVSDGNDTDGYHRIEFKDPNLGVDSNGNPTITSAFWFDPTDQTLYYDDDINSEGSQRVTGGIFNATFRRGTKNDLNVPSNMDQAITIYVRTMSNRRFNNVDASGNVIMDVRDGETVVYLRNP